MIGSWALICTRNLARVCGLPERDASGRWQDWVNELSPSDAELGWGVLLQRFGRQTSNPPRVGPHGHLLAYVSDLEREFQVWLNEMPEVIDYFLVSRKIGGKAPMLGWCWLREHQEWWRVRGRVVDGLPKGIRLAPLASASLEAFIEEHLVRRVCESLSAAAASKIEAERWLADIENACGRLDLNCDGVIGDALALLRKTRRRGLGVMVKGTLGLPDVIEMRGLALRKKVTGLDEGLAVIARNILSLAELGFVDHWIPSYFTAKDMDILVKVIPDLAAQGKLQFLVQTGYSEHISRSTGDALNRLRESLSAVEFSALETKLDLIQAAIGSSASFEARLRQLEKSFQLILKKKIDQFKSNLNESILSFERNLSYTEKLEQVAFDPGYSDHWTDRKT